MKKYLTKLTLITLASSNLLFGDIVFNLGAQQFANSIEGKFKDATYDLPHTIVSTSLKFDNGHYIPNQSGSFKVQLKKPKSKWGVTFDVNTFLNTRGFGVTLMSKEGRIVTIFFSQNKISVSGKSLEEKSLNGHKEIMGSVESDGKSIDVIINGMYTFKVEKPNFQLAYVDVNLAIDWKSGYEQPDKLNSLTISTTSN